MSLTAGFANQFLDLTVLVEELDTRGPTLGPLLIVSSDTTFDGTERYRSYATIAQAAADNTATELSASALAAVTAAFSAARKPSRVLVGRRNGSGSEAWDTALDAIRTAGASFAYLVADTRTIADQMTIGTWAAAQTIPVLYLAQSGDSSWLNSGVPSGWVHKSTTAPMYHPTSTEWFDAEAGGFISAGNPDVKCQRGTAPIAHTAPYALTQTQADAAAANGCNVIQAWEDADTADTVPRKMWVGYMGGTSRIKTQITRSWVIAQVRRRLGNLISESIDLDDPLPANTDGIALVRQQFTDLGSLGVQAGHFTVSEALPDGFAIDSASVNASTLAATISVRYGLLDNIESLTATVRLVRG